MTWPGEIALMRPVARIAQSVEQRIENPRVLGSIPSPDHIQKRHHSNVRPFCYARLVEIWRVSIELAKRKSSQTKATQLATSAAPVWIVIKSAKLYRDGSRYQLMAPHSRSSLGNEPESALVK